MIRLILMEVISVFIQKKIKEDDDKYKNTLEKVIASHEQDEYKEL